MLEPELETFRNDPVIKEFAEQDEDILSYAQFGQVAVKIFERRRNKKYDFDTEHLDMQNKVHPV